MKRKLLFGAIFSSVALSVPGYAQEFQSPASAFPVETFAVVPKTKVEAIPLSSENIKPVASIKGYVEIDKRTNVDTEPKPVYIPVKIVDKIEMPSDKPLSFKSDEQKDKDALALMYKSHEKLKKQNEVISNTNTSNSPGDLVVSSNVSHRDIQKRNSQPLDKKFKESVPVIKIKHHEDVKLKNAPVKDVEKPGNVGNVNQNKKIVDVLEKKPGSTESPGKKFLTSKNDKADKKTGVAVKSVSKPGDSENKKVTKVQKEDKKMIEPRAKNKGDKKSSDVSVKEKEKVASINNRSDKSVKKVSEAKKVVLKK